MQIPSLEEVKRGYTAFQLHEKRDAMYKTATFLVDYFWGKPSEMANSLGVLLLTWNQALYRYGQFDFNKLETCISANQAILDRYRKQSILDYSPTDDPVIRHLFQQFLEALEICEGKKAGVKSPVGTVKALHLLAPNFFPLWDDKIAQAYDCHYAYRPVEKYLAFIRINQQMAERLHHYVNWQVTGKTLIKLIDEYNYATFTKKWVEG
jgi:hypothetical protein